jgi:hypothetical protein
MVVGGRIVPERYQREIEEILRRMAQEAPNHPPESTSRESRWRQMAKTLLRVKDRFAQIATPGNLIKLSLALLLASLVLRTIMPRFSVYATSIGLVLLVVGIAGFVMSEHSPNQIGWRGQPLDAYGRGKARWQVWWERFLANWR